VHRAAVGDLQQPVRLFLAEWAFDLPVAGRPWRTPHALKIHAIS
jgi:hypothetical protein